MFKIKQDVSSVQNYKAQFELHFYHVYTDPVPTRRGININKAKWDSLKDLMAVIRDFVPELNDASIGLTIQTVFLFNKTMFNKLV